MKNNIVYIITILIFCLPKLSFSEVSNDDVKQKHSTQDEIYKNAQQIKSDPNAEVPNLGDNELFKHVVIERDKYNKKQ